MKFVRYLGLFSVLVFGGVYWAYSSFLKADYPQPPAGLSGQVLAGEMNIGGHDRTYKYYVPAKLAENPALVFAFHGSQGNGARARISYAYGLDELADKHGFIVVYGDGFEDHWNDCRKDGDYAANTQNIDDVSFVRSMITFFVERYNADPKQVVATGISNGGHMAYRLAYEAPELISAAVAFAAAVPAGDNLDCAALGTPVNMAIVNGSGDPLVPPGGGVQNIFGMSARGTVLSMADSIGYWVRIGGYGIKTVDPIALPDVDKNDQSHILISSWDEPGKPLVRLYEVVGGGHTIPTAKFKFPAVLGVTNSDIEGADLVWQFFQDVKARQ